MAPTGMAAASRPFKTGMRIRMYTTSWCGFCEAAETLLRRKGLTYEKIDLSTDASFRAKLFDLTGHWTIPQILIDDHPIGGYTELRTLDLAGGLDALLAG
jgi:glutaredoxin 3